MTHLKAVLLVFLVIFSGCKSIPPECRTEYAHTIMHCPPPRPRPPANGVECKQADGVPVYKNGRYIECLDQDGVRDFLRRMGMK